MRIILLSMLLCLSACGPEIEKKTGQVFDNAGGIIRGSKQEINKQWQPVDRSSNDAKPAKDSEEELQKRRRY